MKAHFYVVESTPYFCRLLRCVNLADFKPTETPKRRSNGANPAKQGEEAEVYTVPFKNRIIRAVIYAAPGIGRNFIIVANFH